ncbi:MAG: hypothetical protein HC799_04710 [Limnothrix sp. RL_2_0]|nr:hypothetical protein [Limnothrix sp. RL_2_0]
MEEFDAQKQIIQKAIADITAGRDINIGDVTQIVNVPQPERFIPEDMPANLPTSNTVKFVGREKKLIELHELLKSRQAVMVTALAGMGGVGKTELATQYAWLYYLTEGYPGGICWVRARNEDLGLQITGFTREKFGLKIPDDITDPVARVKHCWDRWLAGNVLIIFVATEYVDLLADENEEIVWLFTGLARFYENQTLYLDTENGTKNVWR